MHTRKRDWRPALHGGVSMLLTSRPATFLRAKFEIAAPFLTQLQNASGSRLGKTLGRKTRAGLSDGPDVNKSSALSCAADKT